MLGVLEPQGLVHLKQIALFTWLYFGCSQRICRKAVVCSSRYLQPPHSEDVTAVQTFYEQKFLEQGIPITYLCFQMETHAG